MNMKVEIILDKIDIAAIIAEKYGVHTSKVTVTTEYVYDRHERKIAVPVARLDITNTYSKPKEEQP